MTEREFITGGEFGRWRRDFSEWQDRLEQRLESGFVGINTRLDSLNGRTRKCEQDIATLRVPAQEPTRGEQWKNAGKVSGISAAVIAIVEAAKAALAAWK